MEPSATGINPSSHDLGVPRNDPIYDCTADPEADGVTIRPSTGKAATTVLFNIR
jgi:hypothetical protein